MTRPHVGQDMHEHDAGRAGAQRAGSTHELALAQRERRAAYQPRDCGPANERDDNGNAPEAEQRGLRPLLGDAQLGDVKRRQHDQQRQPGKRNDAIG